MRVRDKVVGLGSDIVITNFDSQQSYQTVPIVANDSLLHLLKTLEGVKHVQHLFHQARMIMTTTAFRGMVLKKVFSHGGFKDPHLQEGRFLFSRILPLLTKVLVSLLPTTTI